MLSLVLPNVFEAARQLSPSEFGRIVLPALLPLMTIEKPLKCTSAPSTPGTSCGLTMIFGGEMRQAFICFYHSWKRCSKWLIWKILTNVITFLSFYIWTLFAKCVSCVTDLLPLVCRSLESPHVKLNEEVLKHLPPAIKLLSYNALFEVNLHCLLPLVVS